MSSPNTWDQTPNESEANSLTPQNLNALTEESEPKPNETLNGVSFKEAMEAQAATAEQDLQTQLRVKREKTVKDGAADLEWAKKTAEVVVSDGHTGTEAVELLQNAWSEEFQFGQPLSKGLAEEYIQKAQEAQGPQRRGAFQRGEVLDVAMPTFLLDGFVRNGATNALVAQAKVGKTMFEFGLIGALARGDETFLGRRLSPSRRGKNCPPVYIVANDQNLADHCYILQREGLWEGKGVIENEYGEPDRVQGTFKEPIAALWDSGCDCGLTHEYIDKYVAMAAQHKESIWIFDCYTSLLGLGTEENTSQFGDMARYLQQAFSRPGINATVIVAHHANASVSGGSAGQASSGHKSFGRSFSHLTLMNYLTQTVEGQTRSDHRIMISSLGRTGRDSVCAEIGDDGWILHGNADDLEREQARDRYIDKLGESSRGKCYWIIVGYSSRNQGVTRSMVRNDLAVLEKGMHEKARQQVDNYIRGLLKAGVLWEQPNALNGQGLLYAYGYGDDVSGVSGVSGMSEPVSGHENSVLTALKGLKGRQGHSPNGGQTKVDSFDTLETNERVGRPFNKDEWIGQPMEVFQGGEWKNHYRCCAASPHSIDVHQILSSGAPIKRKGLIPWEQVRPCTKTDQVVEHDDDDII